MSAAIRKQMGEIAGDLGGLIGRLLPPRMGFALSVFTLSSTPQYVAWISNAQRDDIVRVLREQADRLEHGISNTAGDA